MNYREYAESVRDVEVPQCLEFRMAVMWLHPEILPLGLVSLGDTEQKIIKVPAMVRNRYDRMVPVIAIARDAFAGNTNVTDIILPSSVEKFPEGAFAGCTALKNITVPRRVRTIRKDVFAGCRRLENVYYEGTPEEWERLRVVGEEHEIEFGDLIPGTPVQEIVSESRRHIPGNEALFSADIHFGCDFEKADKGDFSLRAGGRDITSVFRTM